MKPCQPFLSIIIATYNAGKELEHTLQSLSSLSTASYEVHIQDGLSQDNTLALCESYKSRLPLRIVSGADKGIYDAWNKALDCVQGKWLLFLGAGDKIDGVVLQTQLNNLAFLDSTVDFFANPIVLHREDGTIFETVSPSHQPHENLAQGMCLPHPGLFHRTSVVRTAQFDSSLRIAGDYDFVCRTVRKNNIVFGDIPAISMLAGGVSASMESMYASEKELFALSRKYFPRTFPWKPTLRLLRSFGYLGIRKMAGKECADIYADIPRILLGKEKLWSRRELQREYPTLPARPSIDLLVATVGRKDELRRLLQSLGLQSYTNFHVFLADQNCAGYLDDMLEEFSRLSITRIMLPSEGVSKARNALLPLSSAEIVVFPDDDCWYAPDTLEQVVHAFQKQSTASALLGVWRSSENALQARYGKNGGVSPCGCFRHAGTCVQFYRREAVQEAKQFDEILGPGTELPYGCGEDTDFLLRASAKGKVLRNDSIKVFHPDVDPSKIPDKKIADYAAGRMYLLKKHKFPLCFVAANVFLPLFLIPADCLRGRKGMAIYRWKMFLNRLKEF